MNQLNKENSELFISRLHQLNEIQNPLWGKMNAAEMMQHCRKALDVPLGNLELKPNWFFRFFLGKMIKKKVTDDSIYKPSLPTAPEFVTHDKSLIFEEEKGKLVNTINEFVSISDDLLNQKEHALFGKMTASEWRISQWKHLDHHWRQFGI